MDKILFSNSFKNLMVALGAKTSDSSYAVPLINKTSGAPQGYMEMSALASVLGVYSTKNKVYSQQTTVGQTITIPGTSYGIYAAFDYLLGYTAIVLVGFRTIKVVEELFTASRKYTFTTNDSSQLLFTLNGDTNGVLDVYNLVKR